MNCDSINEENVAGRGRLVLKNGGWYDWWDVLSKMAGGGRLAPQIGGRQEVGPQNKWEMVG